MPSKGLDIIVVHFDLMVDILFDIFSCVDTLCSKLLVVGECKLKLVMPASYSPPIGESMCTPLLYTAYLIESIGPL